MMENTNNKVYMADLASGLAKKCGVTKKEAQKFLTDFIECIKNGVDNDRQVKIKGLGTFKVIDVEARQSVNVNTGERVLIESHQKLTFTPDSLMKDLVNKPFSHFETIVLNDGVEFGDDKREEEEVDVIPEPLAEPDVQEELSEPVVEEEPETIPEPLEETEPEPQEDSEPIVQENVETEFQEEEEVEVDDISEPVVQDESETQLQEDTEPEPLENVEPTIVEEQPGYQETLEKSYKWLWLILAIVACIVSFAWGYWFGSKKQQTPSSKVDTELTITETPEESATQETPTEVVVPEPQEKMNAEQPVAEPQVANSPEPEADWQKYDKMDQRIRLGFYGIVGIKDTVTARSGETLARLSRRILGSDMECYVEVVNNLKATDTLTAGQKIKIPKLVSKRVLRQQLENSSN